MKTLKICNEFGITPVNNFVSAGMDFFIPNISEDKIDIALKEFEKSYKLTSTDINNILSVISSECPELNENNKVNVLHLYLALTSVELNNTWGNAHSSSKVEAFLEKYLIFDENGKIGINLKLNDAILINSGIRVALEPGTAGIFFNKSGKGNQGFDVRAQVVDEDYTGLVHLSLAFTKDTTTKIYCGDKITQMVILPVIHSIPMEVSSNEYFEIMKDSKRGDNSFGSSDIKH